MNIDLWISNTSITEYFMLGKVWNFPTDSTLGFNTDNLWTEIISNIILNRTLKLAMFKLHVTFQ